MGNKIIEQVNEFKFLGCSILPFEEIDIKKKIVKFNKICGTIQRTLHNKVRKETMIRLYKNMAVPAGLCGSETTSFDISR
ncbi:MAG: hypothetical protein ACTS8P_01505 [Arsenophonus sp. NC-XBC3-MAG3]